MQAWHYGLASPPIEYQHSDALDSSQASDSDSDCSSSATLASTASSLSTLASAASASMWSAPSSQNSDSTTISGAGCESYTCGESQDAYQQTRLVTGKLFGESLPNPAEISFHRQTQHQSSHAREASPHPEPRKNPRRTSAACSASRGHPPTLIRQVDRKVEFVDKLVGKETIQLHRPKCPHAQPPIQILPRISLKPYGRHRRCRAAPTSAPARASCRSGSSSRRLCAARARVTRPCRWDCII